MSVSNGTLPSRKTVLQCEYSDFQDAFLRQFVRPNQNKPNKDPATNVTMPPPKKHLARPQVAASRNPVHLKKETIDVDLTIEPPCFQTGYWTFADTPQKQDPESAYDLVKPEIKPDCVANGSEHWADINVLEAGIAPQETPNGKPSHETSIEDEICNYVLYKHTLEPDAESTSFKPVPDPDPNQLTQQTDNSISYQGQQFCDYDSSHGNTFCDFGRAGLERHRIAKPVKSNLSRKKGKNTHVSYQQAQTYKYCDNQIYGSDIVTPVHRTHQNQKQATNFGRIKHAGTQRYDLANQRHSYNELANQSEPCNYGAPINEGVLVVQLPHESSGYVPVAVHAIDNYIVTTLHNYE